MKKPAMPTYVCFAEDFQQGVVGEAAGGGPAGEEVRAVTGRRAGKIKIQTVAFR